MKVRNTQCPSIHKGRNKGTHSTCTICVRRATRMAAARGLEASKFRLEDEAHLNLQYEHRLYYYKHRELGCRSAAFAPERVSILRHSFII